MTIIEHYDFKDVVFSVYMVLSKDNNTLTEYLNHFANHV